MVAAALAQDWEHWRKRAEEMRRLAQDINDAQVKALMIKIAGDYDKLANRADLRAGRDS